MTRPSREPRRGPAAGDLALGAAAWVAGALLVAALALWPLQRVRRAPVPHERVEGILEGRPALAAALTEGAGLGRSVFSVAGGEVRTSFVLCNADGTTPWGWDFEASESLFLKPALRQLGPHLRVSVESEVLFCPPLGRGGELPLEEVPAHLQGASWGGSSTGTAEAMPGRDSARSAPQLRFVLYLADPDERPAVVTSAPSDGGTGTGGRRLEACLVPDLGGLVLLEPALLENVARRAGSAFVLEPEDLAPAFGAFLAQLGRLLGVERGPAVRHHGAGAGGGWADSGSRGGPALPLAVPPAPLSLSPEWDSRDAFRRHALHSTTYAVSALHSVSRLIEELRTLPVPAEVSGGILASVEALEMLDGALAAGDWEAVPGLAQAAARAAEGALHHDSMLAELHIPPEQIAAVFIPFWFPAAVTAASNLSKAYRIWGRRHPTPRA